MQDGWGRDYYEREIMDVSTRPNCKRCNTPLSGQVTGGLTVCPGCGKRWELTPDCLAIKTTVLTVRDARRVGLD
jgi:hypothetical protein